MNCPTVSNFCYTFLYREVNGMRKELDQQKKLCIQFRGKRGEKNSMKKKKRTKPFGKTAELK